MAFVDHLSRTVRGRSLAVSRPLVLAGVAVLSLAPLASAVSASAAPAARPPAISLFGGSTTFRVGGHTWNLSIFVVAGTAGIDLSTTNELDTWSFLAVPKSDLKANASTGKATFNAHNAMAPVAFANLKFTPTSRHKASCRSGSEVFFDGRVTGSISLVANHKGLKFRSAHATFKGSSLDVDHQCVAPAGTAACASGIWSVGSTAVALGSSGGLPGRQTYFVSINKTVNLSAPKHASVSYEVFGSGSKPVFNSKRKSLSVKGTKVVKGSAVIVAQGSPFVTTFKCTLNHTKFKLRDASYSGNYSSPSGGQFQGRSIVGGLLKVARSGFGFFDIISLKKA